MSFTLAGILFCIFTYAQNVHIPDPNFKAYLLSDPFINTNGDSEIQVSEASSFTGAIICHYQNITSMVGIEAFVSLTVLNCDANNLTSLDVSKNIALTSLSFFNNQITNIDVSKNKALTDLQFTNNKLTSLDVSNNVVLKSLDFGNNLLTSLDVSKNPNLTTLGCYRNQLTSLDVSKNQALIHLDCSTNLLTSLDVSSNLTLTYFICFGNFLTSLDVSKNPAIIVLLCSSNVLTNLNIRNGNNTKMISHGFANNPNLTCIQVDDVAYASSNWISKDSWASYSTNCSLSVNDVKKSILKIYPNPVKNNLTIQTDDKLIKAEIYSTTGQLVKAFFQNNANVDGLQKGNYLIKITTDKGTRTEKFIKQ